MSRGESFLSCLLSGDPLFRIKTGTVVSAPEGLSRTGGTLGIWGGGCPLPRGRGAGVAGPGIPGKRRFRRVPPPSRVPGRRRLRPPRSFPPAAANRRPPAAHGAFPRQTPKPGDRRGRRVQHGTGLQHRHTGESRRAAPPPRGHREGGGGVCIPRERCGERLPSW